MGKRYFSDKIVKWYLENRRPLPWRETNDPYRLWLSEVILQQTRVAQGLPYYHNFTTAFPSVRHLAEASEQQVLRMWQGLGYYTRARNLHKCAKAVVKTHQGRFPTTSADLQKLPGIGQYTAAAVASFAFGEKVAVLDGNVFRILSRIFGVDSPINTNEGRKKFLELANELISEKHPALHNQAVMEFGATFCTPHNPRCSECPFQSSCVAYHHDLISVLPLKAGEKKIRNRYFYYLVLQKKNSLLMRKRTAKDIWQGLFDFALIEKDRPVKGERLAEDSRYKSWFGASAGAVVSDKYVHILTHQKIHCRFVHLKVAPSFRPGEEGLRFYTQKEIDRLPKPALISRFLDEWSAC